MTVLSLQDERLERQLTGVLEEMKQAPDRESRRSLWEKFVTLHGQRTPERVRQLEEARGLNG